MSMMMGVFDSVAMAARHVDKWRLLEADDSLLKQVRRNAIAGDFRFRFQPIGQASFIWSSGLISYSIWPRAFAPVACPLPAH